MFRADWGFCYGIHDFQKVDPSVLEDMPEDDVAVHKGVQPKKDNVAEDKQDIDKVVTKTDGNGMGQGLGREIGGHIV